MLALLAALLVAVPAPAQDDKDKPKAKKKAAQKKAAPGEKGGARQKPTPEQIRKFNELQKKQQQKQ